MNKESEEYKIRLAGFERIVRKLNENGIHLIDIDNGCPVLEKNGYKIVYNIMTWEVAIDPENKNITEDNVVDWLVDMFSKHEKL